MRALRDPLAALFRMAPRVRGKARIGTALGRLLTREADDADCLALVHMRDGSRMKLDVRSRSEVWAYWTGEYDADIVRRLAACLEPRSVVLDVGANVGFYTVALGRRLAPLGGRLIAFEPVPSNYARLQEQIGMNELDSTVCALNMALGDDEGELPMWLEDTHHARTGNAILLIEGNSGWAQSNTSARVTRLDTVAGELGISSCRLIKVDIEGAEHMFLRGASGFVTRFRPIIYGEFNPYHMRQFGHGFVDIAAMVVPWGYRLYRQVHRAKFVEIEEPRNGVADVLLVPEETDRGLLTRMGVG